MYNIPIVSIKLVKENNCKYSKKDISSSQDVFNLIKDIIKDSDRETYISICLDCKNKPTHINKTFIGTIESVIANPREILKLAITSNSSKIITAHNHPSGDVRPSKSDTKSVELLKKAADIVGIKLIDHIIVGDEKYYSFADENIL